ncbi:MAG: ATP-dependent DNA helicase, partial [Oscillospiraceae bacterium]|nr:ATP-dependent DNA helicase [Oscillospiraceae bacterium]
YEAPPSVAERKFKDGEPLLYAYGCALLEREISSGFVYTAVNLTTGKSVLISRRKDYPLESDILAMSKLIAASPIAGARRYQADRPVKEHIGIAKAREILKTVFNDFLPQYGYNIRAEQIDLAGHILNTIFRHGLTLAEAETGTGKTEAYLIPAIIAKRGRLNDFHNMSLYPQMQYADMPKMPIVIATSSIALQRAILAEYIPKLSDIMIESGVIRKPLTAILRKGRENYICVRKLKTYLATIGDRDTRLELENLLQCGDIFDLAEVEGFSPKIRQTISVDGRCFDTCPNRETCQYTAFREQALSLDIDIQVCNHNYLLADTLHRAQGRLPLIPNYQMLIIDEAHKFLSAARTMYGAELSDATAPQLLRQIDEITFRREGLQTLARKAAKKLSDESARLFRQLMESPSYQNDEDGSDKIAAMIDKEAARHLRNIRDIAERLIATLYDEALFLKAGELLLWVSRKYGADVNAIDLGLLLSDAANDDETRKAQAMAVHKSICGLKGVRCRVMAEREKRLKKSLGYNTEREAFKNAKSKILDAIWEKSRLLFRPDVPMGRNSERIIRIVRELAQVRDQANALKKHSELICWLETGMDGKRLCAIPNNLGKRLFHDQWNKKIPTILASGTLSAGGDFARAKQALGLNDLGYLQTETSKPSPFDYMENTLLYISENTPFPEKQSNDYINAVTDEVEKLIIASHGHAAVLFTSYKAMDMVWEQLTKRKLPFPKFRLDRGGVREIESFRQSNGGILFASGALWEGIDIPGDALSMLIIVKLPFQVPDPISEYEQTLYPDFHTYRDGVIVPEMLVKLKQGFGRLIRKETDTGIVAILDCRANKNGFYRECVLNALPPCRVTDSITEVKNFFETKKTPEYFINNYNDPDLFPTWEKVREIGGTDDAKFK